MNPGLPDQDVESDVNASVYSKSFSASGSSGKKSLKRVLVSKMKLDLVRARAKEEAEAARMAYEHKQRMELRHLEEEASLAEWKIETEYNDEGGLTPSVASPSDTSMSPVDKRPHCTRPLPRKLRPVDLTSTQVPLPCTEKSITPVSGILEFQDSMKAQPKSSFSAIESNVPMTLDSVKSHQSFRVPSVQHSQRATCGDHAPRDPVAAMWKAQMLTGMRPTRSSGNPVDFPFCHLI